MTTIIHLPADNCPHCGASLFGSHIVLFRSHVGGHGGWSDYGCLACGGEFRMYWPGLNRSLVNRARLAVKGHYEGA